MPTTVTSTIKSSGGDYASLNAWEAAKQGDITAATGSDEIQQAECYSFQDTTAVTIFGWTTSAANYIRIYTPTAERHDGTWSTDKYYLSVSDATALSLAEPYTRIEGLQIETTSPTANGRRCVSANIGAAGANRVEACVIKGHNSGTYSQNGLVVAGATTDVECWNTVFFNFAGIALTEVALLSASTSSLTCYSVSGFGGDYGIAKTSGTLTAKNCYWGGANTSDFASVDTMTTCASSDTTGSTGLQSIAVSTANFVNVSSGTEDYHLTDESALRGVGTDTSGDAAPLDFTDDIDGDTRSTTAANWHVGADHGALATITKTVKSSGGDYASVNAWEAAQQADIESLNQIREAECYSFQDTATCVIDGWTTAAANYIRVFAAAGNQHTGTRSSSAYRLEGTNVNAGVLRPREDFQRFEGLQLKNLNSNGAGIEFHASSGTVAGEMHIVDCLVYDSGWGFFCNNASGSTKFYFNNCIVLNSNNDGWHVDASQTTITVDAYNCVAVNNGGAGFHVDSSRTLNCKNCYAGGNTGSDYSASGTLNTTTCHDEDGTADTTTAWSTAHFTNVTSGSEDIHITAGSGLRGVGTDLGGEAQWIHPDGDVDIDGDTRSSWDVGADEFVAVGHPAARRWGAVPFMRRVTPSW